MQETTLAPVERVEAVGRVLHLNGRPFVPIFAWWVYEDELPALARSGVNLALSPRADPAYARAARRLGMYIGANPRADLAGDPALLLWMQEDEPDIRIPQGPRLLMDENEQARSAVPTATLTRSVRPVLQERLDLARRHDPSRPVFLNVSYLFLPRFWGPEAVSRPLYAAMAEYGNVVSWDIYPVGGWGKPEWLGVIHHGTRRLRELAGEKPLFVFLECTQFEFNGREPSEAEMRNQVWQAVAAGATGIGWFTYGLDLKDPAVQRKTSFAVTPHNVEAMHRINDELRRRTDAVVAAEVLGGVRYGAGGLPEVLFSVRRDASAIHLIAANTTYEPRSLGDGLETWGPGDDAEAVRAALPAEAWADLAPLEVRILRVERP